MDRLTPNLDLLAQEYVLVQAWKKTSAYIRYHNWFADTLDLDMTTANLPQFITNLSNRILSGQWQSSPLRLVPAPKSQKWRIDEKRRLWQPCEKVPATKTRPLAHVSLDDQVVATAIMLCLADRVETVQGDPTSAYSFEKTRATVTSYGNRLFCDYEADSQTLVHRWGSSKLYRAYFQDYKNFVARPEYVAEQISQEETNIVIVQADLRQFYDRVRPSLLIQKIRQFQTPEDDERFFQLADSVFSWSWSPDDLSDVARFARESGIPQFESVALPQGLVSAGFFSNAVLLGFDMAMRARIGHEVAPGILLHDACRYVDDLRLTVAAVPGLSAQVAGERLADWLNALLGENATGLQIAPEKTQAAAFRGEEQPLVRQARKMQRIQSAISGGFDAAGGEEVIQAVQGLVRSQAELNAANEALGMKSFTAVPDVRDETIGRFAAARFRTTFRSLRPLLEARPILESAARPRLEAGDLPFRRTRISQAELDDEGRSFALGLINTWVLNPSNVRLLRIAVDLWPTPQVLEEILNLFEPYITGQSRGNARKVAFYCLSELFKAGATETGIVPDPQTLPDGVDLEGYRSTLAIAARRVARIKAKGIPWYLRQQALLFLAAFDPKGGLDVPRSEAPLLSRYFSMIGFLNGRSLTFSNIEYAIASVVTRRSFLPREAAIKLVAEGGLDAPRFSEIASRDLDFARELHGLSLPSAAQGSALEDDLGTKQWTLPEGVHVLKELVTGRGNLNPLRNEIGVLTFSIAFLQQAIGSRLPSVVTPSSLHLEYDTVHGFAHVTSVSFQPVEIGRGYRSIYTPPSWAEPNETWRFQLGFLIRFILTGKVDFSKTARAPSWKDDVPMYRPTNSHWLQRLYGFYNGHESFGDDWLPISQFTQDLLYSLLAWPGCRADTKVVGIDSIPLMIEVLSKNLKEAEASIGDATGLLMLQVRAPNPSAREGDRPLRACVVQTVTPESFEIANDLTLSSTTIRRKHRNHLSTALAAVEKMLELRDTHVNQNNRLDWLILPELSVHPDDVRSHLIPFARAFRTIILAGMTYEELFSNQPLVNSGLWIIPRMVEGRGLQIVTRRQGKHNLAREEQKFNVPTAQVQGFRPCQWLIGYDWTTETPSTPLWLTAAICYDATDLNLAADLRSRSDIFAIPALNRDVNTFDQMAQALHYHMFQLVLIANNGEFGGSNAHMPRGGRHQRQVFHTHGQPQATISFLEIDNIRDMKRRHELGKLPPASSEGWKFPPAGF